MRASKWERERERERGNHDNRLGVTYFFVNKRDYYTFSWKMLPNCPYAL
jgi:hypothetical protein